MDTLTIMQRLGQGRALEDFGNAVKVMSSEVARTGKAGSVSLKIDIKPLSGQGGLEVGLKETITRTPPKTGERGVILYAYEDDLFPMDPRQPGLPEFTVVGTTVVNANTGEIVKDFEPGDDVKEAF